MECRGITAREFDLILAELAGVVYQVSLVETLVGHHDLYGATTLVRDGGRCMAMVDNPSCFDRFLAVQSFLVRGAAAKVAGRA